MPEWLLHFGNWLQNTSLGLWVSGSKWYPYVQTIHFAGLSLWVGSIALLDLRLMGIAGKRQTATEFARQLTPLTWTGLGIAVVGGFLLFSGIAELYLQNPAFQIKIPIVLVGIAYHVFVLRKVPGWDRPSGLPPAAKVAALLEFALWVYVAYEATEIPAS